MSIAKESLSLCEREAHLWCEPALLGSKACANAVIQPSGPWGGNRVHPINLVYSPHTALTPRYANAVTECQLLAMATLGTCASGSLRCQRPQWESQTSTLWGQHQLPSFTYMYHLHTCRAVAGGPGHPWRGWEREHELWS